MRVGGVRVHGAGYLPGASEFKARVARSELSSRIGCGGECMRVHERAHIDVPALHGVMERGGSADGLDLQRSPNATRGNANQHSPTEAAAQPADRAGAEPDARAEVRTKGRERDFLCIQIGVVRRQQLEQNN